MDDEKIQLYLWEGVHWNFDYDMNGDPYFHTPLCPKQKCSHKLRESEEIHNVGEYKYYCPRCDFKITLNKSIKDKASDLLEIIESQKYKDAEIINIDGELVRVQREQVTDFDYWVDVKISRNKKDEVQLMVLAGSKKEKDKTQLFLDSKNEKMTFDQNNDHPSKIFSKITAIFKNSNSKIISNDEY